MASLGVALLLLGGTGCFGGSSPRVTGIGTATFAERSDEAFRFDVPVELVNGDPDEPLELRQVTYRAWFDGTRVFSGTRSAEATLAPGAEGTVTLPVVVRYDELPRAAERLGSRAEIPWRIEGRLLFVEPGALPEALLDAGVRRPRIGLDVNGVVALPDGLPPEGWREAAPPDDDEG